MSEPRFLGLGQGSWLVVVFGLLMNLGSLAVYFGGLTGLIAVNAVPFVVIVIFEIHDRAFKSRFKVG